MYSNNILNIQESTTILNACTKKSGNLLSASHIFVYDNNNLYKNKGTTDNYNMIGKCNKNRKRK